MTDFREGAPFLFPISEQKKIHFLKYLNVTVNAAYLDFVNKFVGAIGSVASYINAYKDR